MRILLLDIETRPLLGWVWGIWKQNISATQQLKEDWQIITWAAKWYGDDYTYYATAEGKKDDKECLEDLWHLLDEADVVIGHNGDKFDLPKINARFLQHGIKPPSPYKTIDTLKVAKANFRLTSNRLDYIAKFLGYGGKVETGGMDLWIKCMEGDRAAWKQMLIYNIHDVQLLEWVYEELRPWIKGHPNVALYTEGEDTICPACGSNHIHYRGFAYTPVGKYQRFVCNDCGKWGRLAENLLPKNKRKYLGRNIA